MVDLRQLQQHMHALTDGDATSALEALQSLRQHDEREWASVPSEVIHPLVKALKGRLVNGMKQVFAQKGAAAILGNLGARSRFALPQLIELLNDGVPDLVRDAAVTALGKMGKDAKGAIEPIICVLAKARPALSAQAIRALGNIGCADNRVRSVLVNLWLAPLQDQGSKAQAAIALCKLGLADQSLLLVLAKILVTNQDASLRKAAAEALGWCSKEATDVVPALLAASFGETNEEVRQVAQAGLDQMGIAHEKAIPLCCRQLGESSYAEAALRKSGTLAVPFLIEALGAKEPTVRVKAARTLGCLGEEATGAALALVKVLRHKDVEVRLAAAKSLWSITKKVDVVVPALVDLLDVKESVDWEAAESRRRFLQTVMEALSRIGPPAQAAVSALVAMTKDNNRHIRESALIALQRIAPTVESMHGPVQLRRT